MNGNFDEDELRHASREEIISALFANMVIQHSQMALMLLGRAPNPNGGPPMKDLEGAKRFIDELEMIAEKTKGNLNPKEEQLMRQSLGTLRMLFVQEMEAQMSEEEEQEQPQSAQQFKMAPEPQVTGMFTPPPPPSVQTSPGGSPPESASSAESEPKGPIAPDESRKKFVKKY